MKIKLFWKHEQDKKKKTTTLNRLNRVDKLVCTLVSKKKIIIMQVAFESESLEWGVELATFYRIFKN